MRVNAWKNIDVEVEVEVDLNTVLSEFFDRAKEATPDYYRRFLPVLDSVTKILAKMSDDVIAALPSEARKILCERLQGQAKRYALSEGADE